MLVRAVVAEAFETNCYVVAAGPGEPCLIVMLDVERDRHQAHTTPRRIRRLQLNQFLLHLLVLAAQRATDARAARVDEIDEIGGRRSIGLPPPAQHVAVAGTQWHRTRTQFIGLHLCPSLPFEGPDLEAVGPVGQPRDEHEHQAEAQQGTHPARHHPGGRRG